MRMDQLNSGGLETMSLSEADPILGTWAIQVSGSRWGSFEALLTFMAGGGCVGVATDRPPSLIQPGLGTWRRVAGGRYALTLKEYGYSEQGAFTHVIWLHYDLTMEDADRWSARAAVVPVDRAGEQLRPTNIVSVEAKRLAVEAFPD